MKPSDGTVHHVTDADAVATLYAATVARGGGLDLLFVNAGVSLDQSPVESSDPQAFEETMRVNLFGAYHCARLAVPRHARAARPWSRCAARALRLSLGEEAAAKRPLGNPVVTLSDPRPTPPAAAKTRRNKLSQPLPRGRRQSTWTWWRL
jgi:NAD(P)-dependent dehydrogenase (short-subunit alcohol dehydrogenase family)